MIDELIGFRVALTKARKEYIKREERRKQRQNENNTSNSTLTPVSSSDNTTDHPSFGRG